MRYSDHAQSVIYMANQEAARLNHDHISTGHLLLGLIREGEGAALSFLKSMNVDLEKVKTELESTMEVKGHGAKIGQLKFTSRANKAFELASEESQKMGHKYVGTEHILLGIILEQDGVAPKILEKSGIDADKARAFAMSLGVDEEDNFDTLTFNDAKMMVSSKEPFLEGYSESIDAVINLEDACNLLKIDMDDMNRLLMEENVPGRMIAGQWRFSRNALIKWLGEGKSKDYFPK